MILLVRFSPIESKGRKDERYLVCLGTIYIMLGRLYQDVIISDHLSQSIFFSSIFRSSVEKQSNSYIIVIIVQNETYSIHSPNFISFLLTVEARFKTLRRGLFWCSRIIMLLFIHSGHEYEIFIFMFIEENYKCRRLSLCIWTVIYIYIHYFWCNRFMLSWRNYRCSREKIDHA